MNNDAVRELLNAVGALAEMSLNFLQGFTQCWCDQRRSLCAVAVIHLCFHSRQQGGKR